MSNSLNHAAGASFCPYTFPGTSMTASGGMLGIQAGGWWAYSGLNFGSRSLGDQLQEKDL